jgi:hypothetical protein
MYSLTFEKIMSAFAPNIGTLANKWVNNMASRGRKKQKRPCRVTRTFLHNNTAKVGAVLEKKNTCAFIFRTPIEDPDYGCR